MHYGRVGHTVMRLKDAEFIVVDEFPEEGFLAPPVDDTASVTAVTAWGCRRDPPG
jgi:hypothetical protein